MPAELAQIWALIQGELERTVDASAHRLWLGPLRARALTGEVLVLSAPDAARAWVVDRFGRVLEDCASTVLGRTIEVAVVPESAAPDRPSPRAERAEAADALNPRYTFDQFVIGAGNQLAHAAALAVAELPAQAYNPLFICGAPGLGKTHLLHSIANYLRAHEPDVAVRYTTTEAFTDRFVNAVRGGDVEGFKRSFRQNDVLLIDDVQFLASKARTEEEFFHTFEALHQSGAQIVLSCDRPPRDLQALEDRLRERFAAGLVVEVRPPDLSTRVGILRKRVAQDGVAVADQNALERIAVRVDTSVRALEGALIRVVAFHSLSGRPLDAALVSEVLSGLYPERRRRSPSIDEVKTAVGTAFDVTPEELVSASRAARISWPRHVAMYLTRDLTSLTLPQIGQGFGARNHATVVHACRRTTERLGTDLAAAEKVGTLRAQLSGSR